MPNLPMSPCRFSGCPVIGPCPAHARPSRPLPEVRLYDDRRGSSTQRGYGYAWQQRKTALLLARPNCALCGKRAVEVDHRIPKRLGGSDDDQNLQSICRSCHAIKTKKENPYGQR